MSFETFADYAYYVMNCYVKDDEFFKGELKRYRHRCAHPAISIVIPFYNTEAYIKKNLLSIATQTFENIEVICVDDGSTDRSSYYVNMMCSIDSRFVCLNNEGKGAGAARNTGFKYVKGKYVIFLDSDDYYACNMLMDAYIKTEKEKLEICLIGVEELDNITKQVQKGCIHLQRQHLPKTNVFNSSDIPYIFSITTGAAWNKLFLCEFVKKNNLFFMEQKCFNDVFFVYTALVLATRISALPDDYIFYRVNNAASLQGQKDKDIDCAFRAFDKLYERISNLPEYTELVDISWKNYMISCTHSILYSCRKSESFEKTFHYMHTNKLLRTVQEKEVYEFNKEVFEEYLLILQNSVTSFLFLKWNQLCYLNDENKNLRNQMICLKKMQKNILN